MATERSGLGGKTRGAGFIQIVLVLVVIFVVTMLALRIYHRAGPPAVPGGGHPARAVLDRVELRVEGMDSEVDSLQVMEAIRRVPGVAGVQADSGTGRVQVTFDPNRAGPEKFVAAVERAGFRAWQ